MKLFAQCQFLPRLPQLFLVPPALCLLETNHAVCVANNQEQRQIQRKKHPGDLECNGCTGSPDLRKKRCDVAVDFEYGLDTGTGITRNDRHIRGNNIDIRNHLLKSTEFVAVGQFAGRIPVPGFLKSGIARLVLADLLGIARKNGASVHGINLDLQHLGTRKLALHQFLQPRHLGVSAQQFRIKPSRG